MALQRIFVPFIILPALVGCSSARSYCTQDKAYHFVAGAVTAEVAHHVVERVLPEAPRWQKTASKVLLVSLLAFGKEAYDSVNSKHHDPCAEDAFSTLAGGGLVLSFRFPLD